MISEEAANIYTQRPVHELGYTEFAAHASEVQRISEESFLEKNKDLISLLKTPKGYSLSKNRRVVDLLSEHAKRNGENTPLSKSFICEMVIIGENVAKAIFSQKQQLVREGTAGYTSPVVGDGNQQYEIKSEIFIVRALGWYMMAVAASQDLERQAKGDFGTSDMTTSGTFVMKDPENRIYHFLDNCSGTVHRTSTHFEKYVGHADEHKFFWVISSFGLKKSQRGIEDYRSLFPYPCGAMLFDRIQLEKNEQPAIFIKFEDAGCPSGLEINEHVGYYGISMNLFAAAQRNAQHAFHFLKSRSQKNTQDSGEVLRQEHVHKGVITPLYEGFMKLKQNQEFKEYLKIIKNENPEKYGVTAMRDALEEFAKRASTTGGAESGAASITYKDADALLSKINQEMQRLGCASDRHGIRRIGAEVHITLDPNEVHGSQPVWNVPYARTEAGQEMDVPASEMEWGDSDELFASGNWASHFSASIANFAKPEEIVPGETAAVSQGAHKAPSEVSSTSSLPQPHSTAGSPEVDDPVAAIQPTLRQPSGASGAVQPMAKSAESIHGHEVMPAPQESASASIDKSLAFGTSNASIISPGVSEAKVSSSISSIAPASTAGIDRERTELNSEEAAPVTPKAVRTRSRNAARNHTPPQQNLSAKDEASSFLDWSAFKMDWSALIDFSWLQRLALWK